MSVKDSTKLKGLQSQLKKTEAEYGNLKNEVYIKQAECTAKKNTAHELRLAISKFKDSGEPIVSEHAILRYLERVGGMDIDQIKCAILNEEALGYISSMGSGTYPIENRFKIVVKDNTIVTVLE